MGLDKLIVSACLFLSVCADTKQLRDGDPEPPKLWALFVFPNSSI